MTAVNKSQAQEVIKCGKDPAYFINKYVYISHPLRGTIKFNTFPFQDDCLQSFVDHRFTIVLKSRQMGLSTLIAAYALWYAIFRRDKNILIVATKLKVAQGIIRKVKKAISKLPPWLMLPDITGNNKQEIEFNNGSRIHAVPTSEDAGRSEALSLAIVDEAAIIRDFSEIWTSLYSTLSTGGRAVVLSTPKGVGNKFHELYSKAELGENEFHPVRLPWHLHPERDQDWFDKETRNMSPTQIAQELMCDFIASGDTYLKNDELTKLGMQCKIPIEKWGPEHAVWVWAYPVPNNEYVVSVDVATGSASDFSAIQVFDAARCEQVAEFKGKLPPDKLATLAVELARRYNGAQICPEKNSVGYAFSMKLVDLGYSNLYFANPKDGLQIQYGGEIDISKIGFSTQSDSREKILTKLEECIRNDRVRLYSTRLVDELKTFVWQGNRAKALKGKHDDLVMATAIGVWLLNTESSYSIGVHDFSKAMLAALAVNKTPDPQQAWARDRHAEMARHEAGIPNSVMRPENRSRHGSTILPVTKNFKWLI
jgi:hypothetical protein